MDENKSFLLNVTQALPFDVFPLSLGDKGVVVLENLEAKTKGQCDLLTPRAALSLATYLVAAAARLTKEMTMEEAKKLEEELKQRQKLKEHEEKNG